MYSYTTESVHAASTAITYQNLCLLIITLYSLMSTATAMPATELKLQTVEDIYEVCSCRKRFDCMFYGSIPFTQGQHRQQQDDSMTY